MWNLSAESKRDVATLFATNRRSPAPLSKAETVTRIQKLVDRFELATIPAIASGLFSSKTAIHDASAAGVGKLLKFVPGEQLDRLSELLGRDSYSYRHASPAWERVQPRYVKSYLEKTNDVAVGCLLSLHRNGYVREAAVRFLVNCETNQELPFLLLRQNDWVPAVSQVAQKSCLQKLSPEYLAHFVREIDLIFHLLDCKRHDLSEMVSRFVDLLVAPAHRTHLQKALRRSTRRAGRTFVTYLLDRKGDHLADTVRAGLNSSDMLIRANCVKHADEYLKPTECAELAERLVLDKFVLVRQEAYELMARLSPDNNDFWKRCLFDKSRSLRETAIFYLQKANCDVAALCRERLSDDRDSLPALSSLANCGVESDLQTLHGYLTAPFASRRAEAVRGVGRIGGKADHDKLLLMLLDESTRVVRAAHQQLKPDARSIDADKLFCLIEKCNSIAGRRAFLNLLMEQGRWRSLSYLVRASASPDVALADLAIESIRYTFSSNRNFTQPSANQKQKIQDAIDKTKLSRDADLTQELSRYLSSFGFTFE